MSVLLSIIYASSQTESAGFALAGRYWALARIAADNEPQADAKLRASDEADMRKRVRLAAETSKTAVEFKPCQNVIDYQLPFKISAVKN